MLMLTGKKHSKVCWLGLKPRLDSSSWISRQTGYLLGHLNIPELSCAIKCPIWLGCYCWPSENAMLKSVGFNFICCLSSWTHYNVSFACLNVLLALIYIDISTTDLLIIVLAGFGDWGIPLPKETQGVTITLQRRIREGKNLALHVSGRDEESKHRYRLLSFLVIKRQYACNKSTCRS